MGFLTREQIVKSQDLETREVECPEWTDGEDSTVLVIQPSAGVMEQLGAQVIEFQKKTESDSVPPSIRTWFVAQIVVNEKGARLFSDKEVDLLRKKSMAPIQRIFEAGQEMGGLADTDVEESRKN